MMVGSKGLIPITMRDWYNKNLDGMQLLFKSILLMLKKGLSLQIMQM